MADITWDIHTASEEFLIKLCHETEKENGIVGGFQGSVRIVKLTNDIVVKFGRGVSAGEARTQDFAYRNTDPNIVHIPRVYRFFERDDDPPVWNCSEGYLFMEYVPGPTLKELDFETRPDIVPRVAQIIAHFGQIQGQTPGPVGGGSPDGYLWGEIGAWANLNGTELGETITFTCMSDLNAWINRRLSVRGESVDLSGQPLVLCHLDLARRNMILKDDNIISVVDWGHGGLYPRFYELVTLGCILPRDTPYEQQVIDTATTLLGITEEEERLMWKVRIARAYSLRYLSFGRGRSSYTSLERLSFLPRLPPPDQ